MGLPGNTADANSEAGLLLASSTTPAPSDSLHLAYLTYFILGAGFLLPWNAFITAVDYFSHLYPGVPIDRVFAVTYMFAALAVLVVVVCYAHRSGAAARINAGLALFVLCLIVPPLLDAFYVNGRTGVYTGYDLTVVAVVVAGVADALVQGGVVGAAGVLPEIYMQAVFSGTAASGVLVSVLRIITKALFPQDASGLRQSANLYFGVSIAVMLLCILCYNVADHLPVVKHYRELKRKATLDEEDLKGPLTTGTAWRASLRDVLSRIKWHGFGIFMIYVVTLSIFPGFITEDVHSDALGDWYPIALITAYNVFDLVGKAMPAVCLLEDQAVAVGGTVARLIFLPLYLLCLHGPAVLRTEVPVTILTCLLGLTNGYLTTILMMMAPKTVPIQHAELAGIAIVLFLVVGLVVGSVVTWFWVI